MNAPPDRALLRACAGQADGILARARPRSARRAELAAYLAVVELELPAPQVRRRLGWTRGQLDAACLEVEELREEAGLDEAIAAAAAALRAVWGGEPAPAAPPPVPVAERNARRAARAARRALELLVRAGGEVVAHEAFGTVETARTAICAARKEIGPEGIRTVRGRGFRITEAGLRIARDRVAAEPTN